jgi:hypothetical protein
MRAAELHQSPHWVRYTDQSLNDDFVEYKKKEEKKWRSRALSMGFRWPIFDTVQDFQQALDTAQVVDVHTIGPVSNMTRNQSIEDIKDMVDGYAYPRDVDRIVVGIEQGATMPMPIILQGTKGKWIMAGNTRQAVCRVMGVRCEALLVDVSEDNQNTWK